MGKRERLNAISQRTAMIIAMERAIEWSRTLDATDAEDAEWERQFRERCRRYLERIKGMRKDPLRGAVLVNLSELRSRKAPPT